ncbi:PIN domain-containing protein [Rubrivirga litoralis]|uniref:PIN domain-containing protein n=1 Tax=Rubrivirga litoralis TaxID=3075598 RepID=A0ABU3BRQ3_9BACT|nr:PIN domain-containing protein [Rubrivirga sp. F394]MDT0631975.1 PIN domain-containing protein [Rubrivirga sp. F394]
MVDADVLFAGAASSSSQSASGVVLRLSELTVLEGVASVQVVTEAKRNLAVKVPAAVEALGQLVGACVRVVPDPEPGEVRAMDGRAHPKDLPILVAAVRERCPVLVTFNEKDFRPGHPDVDVVTPGVLVQRVRRLVARAGLRGGQ